MSTRQISKPEMTNRVNLASAIAAELVQNSDAYFTSLPTLAAVNAFDDRAWAKVNKALGRNRPVSDMTKAVVLGILVGIGVD